MKTSEYVLRFVFLPLMLYFVFFSRTVRLEKYLPRIEIDMCESGDCELPMPPSTSLPTDYPFEMSACIIVKEDNQILPEWIAYHYEVLPLRHLIVAVDPYSKISPEPVLEKFRSLPNMTIEMWRDEDYLQKGQFFKPDADRGERLQLHRKRQPTFMKACLESLKKQNKTWTVLIDPDEYWIFNDYDENEEAKPWCFFDANLTRRAECENKYYEDIKNGVHPRNRLPKIGEATVAHYLASELNRTDRYWHFDTPCIIVPRVLFANDESLHNETHAQVPIGFDPNAFYTLRYRHHQPHQSNYPGKPIMDASQYDGSRVENPHRLNEDLCQHAAFVSYAESMFRVHHYIGPRSDAQGRKSDEQYKARLDEVGRIVGTNDEIRGWLKLFAQRVGKKKALELTQELRASALEDLAKLANNQTRRKLRHRS